MKNFVGDVQPLPDAAAGAGQAGAGCGEEVVAEAAAPEPLLRLQVVELRGCEFCQVRTLARTFDMSADSMRELIHRLSESHLIRVLQVGERTALVNVADFHRALVECVPVRNGVAKRF